jgi:hypothetical protein
MPMLTLTLMLRMLVPVLRFHLLLPQSLKKLFILPPHPHLQYQRM